MIKKIKVLPVMQSLGGIFLKYGIRLFIVGGFVRNSLLGLPVSDFDVCSSALPDEVAGILDSERIRVIDKATEFGTVEIHYEYQGERHIFEHTTFRKDHYGEGGTHRPKHVLFTKNMEEDAVRRDFTVNALYADMLTGDVFDVTNRGLKDLQAGKISAAHEDPYQTIKDDGLRLMRLVRFSCELGFTIDSQLYQTAKQNAHLLKDISKERIKTELVKIMLSDTRHQAATINPFNHKTGMLNLFELGLLPIVFPSLLNGIGVLQKSEYHDYDVFMHSVEAYAFAKPDLHCRLAALLHDIGKPAAIKNNGNMYGHETIGAALAQNELKRLTFDKQTIHTVTSLIKNHMFDLENKAKSSTIRKKAAELGCELFTKLIDLRRADFIGSGKIMTSVPSADRWQSVLNEMIEQNTPFSENDLHISGNELMQALNIPAGITVGLIKKRLLQICIQKPSQNNRLNLLSHAKNIYKEIVDHKD